MLEPKRIAREEIRLPKTLDVLFYLPASEELRNKGVILAHAIQYSVCSRGSTQEDALERLIRDVIARCELAAERGVHPVNIAGAPYMKAFFMGDPVQETPQMAEIRVKLSQELRKRFDVSGEGDIVLEMRARSVCQQQKQLRAACVADLVKAA